MCTLQDYSTEEWKCADDRLLEGAFTPGCSVNHLPGFINKLADIKAKGVGLVCVVAFNDAFVMNAWAKANGIKEEIVGYVLHTKKTVD